MGHKCFTRKIAYLLAGVALVVSSFDVQASQTGKSIDELEKEKQKAQEWVGELNEQKNSLQGDLEEFNRQLSDISVQINDLEEQIKEKETAIEVTGEELEEAESTRKSQYERMKLRIQFIYEKGNVNIISVFLGSKSLSDFLNKAEYVGEINRYDNELLDTYQKTCKQVAEKEEQLKTEKSDLVALQEDMEQKKEEVSGLVARTQENIQAKQKEITGAQGTISQYETQIAEMKAYEEELERKKAQEAKRLAEEQKKKAEEQKKKEEAQKAAQAQNAASGQNTQSKPQTAAPPQDTKPDKEETSSGGGTAPSNASDLAMLAALVECEAGGESYEGQLAVASVVVNRVKSGSFPNTISGVIYQGGQFSPVASGRFAVVLSNGANSSCTQAASAALSGGTNIGCLYFCRASSGVAGTVIGNHVFY